MRRFSLSTRRHLHVVLMMTLESMTRRLVNELEAAGVLMCREAFEAAESCAAWSARVIGWKSTDGAEMAFGQLRGRRLSCCIIGSFGIHLPILFEKLHERLSVLDAIIVSPTRLPPLSRVTRWVEVVLKLGNLLRHYQIGVRIVVIIILFERLERLLGSSFSRHIVKDALLIGILYSTRFTCCHRVWNND